MNGLAAFLAKDFDPRAIRRAATDLVTWVLAYERAGLADLVPGSWRGAADLVRPHELLLTPCVEGVAWQARTHSGRRLGSGRSPRFDSNGTSDSNGMPISRADARVGLVLPPKAAFRRSLTAPPLAADRLQAFAQKELALRTPIPAEAVEIHLDVDPTSPRAGPLRVTEILVRKDAIAAAAESVGLSRADIDFVDVPIAADPTRIRLKPAVDPRSRRLTLATRALGWAALALGLAVPLVALTTRDAAITATTASAAGVRATALRVRALQAELEGRARIERALRALAQRPLVVTTWRDLARLLPDDVWVSEWHLHGDTLEVTGFAEKAATLVPLLDHSTAFTGARLEAAVVSDAVTGRERFAISAHLAHPEGMPRR